MVRNVYLWWRNGGWTYRQDPTSLCCASWIYALRLVDDAQVDLIALAWCLAAVVTLPSEDASWAIWGEILATQDAGTLGTGCEISFLLLQLL